MGVGIDDEVNVKVEHCADEGGEIMENLDGPNSSEYIVETSFSLIK